MAGKRITVPQKETFWKCLSEGLSVAEASRVAKFSKASGERLVGNPGNGREHREIRAAKEVPDTPIPLDEVCEEAKAALADRTGFLFCKRYFGYELSPFQMSVWEELENGWDTQDREYLCLNGPPGLGKSTVFVMFAAKRIVLWRAIRVLFMSRAYSLAVKNTGRLRRALERTSPAVGADTTLSADFGRFKPRQGGDVWKRDEYVVEQMDGEPIEEKEATCAAFGFDAEWLGNRIDLLFGDDLDSTRSIQNMETVERNREIFDGELEPRLEGGGLFVIGQQRLGAFDFSAHALSKVILPDDDGSGEEADGVAMYRHVIFKVHYEDRCQDAKTHMTGAPAYPEGCLLDPRRMPWRDVKKAMNRADRFKVVYQQEDPGESEALVQKLWVDGGRGPDGVTYPGCWDRDRGAWELPTELEGERIGVITVDPSPTRFWSVQAWCFHPASQHRFLLDQHRERMEAPDFLEWRHHDRQFTGLGEDWWHNFDRLGVPLRYIIVENNAAQRFTYQQEMYRRWEALRKTSILQHSTHRNKADPDYGIQMLAPVWRHGQVRLPGKQGNPGRIAAMRLVDEVLRYPNSSTTDCVMGQWFLEHNLETIYTPPPTDAVRLRRPTWLRRAS